MAATHNRYIELSAPGISELKPYVPGKPLTELEREFGITDAVKLASNENPLGCSDRIKSVILSELKNLARYPDGSGYELREVLAKKHGLSPECVTLGNGSNDVLDMVARVFLAPGRGSLFSQHSFAVYQISSQSVGATLSVAAAKGFGHDLNAMRDLVNARTRVIWIANPNNPTGTWLESDDLESFVSSLPDHVILVMDEAYSEYAEVENYPDTSLWLNRYPNLIVTRTFSKAYGLAGLRVGYGLSNPQIADLLNRVRQPFNVNSLALAAARVALDDQEFIRRSVEINRDGMEQLAAGFRSLGLDYVPSAGNFLMVDMGRPAAEVDRALQRRGCIARPLAGYGLRNHLRITIGVPAENDRLLHALAQVLQS